MKGFLRIILKELNYHLYGLKDLIFPRSCIICKDDLEKNEKHICLKCYTELPLTYFWGWQDNPAEKRMREKVPIESAVSLFFYRNTGGYSTLIHKIKYEGRIDLGFELGEILGEYIKKSGRFDDIDAIVPVPLHFWKKWKRGFNQAEVIAHGVAKGMTNVTKGGSLPVFDNLLIRNRYTKTQTRLSGNSKKKNVKNAFCLNHKIVPTTMKKGIIHILLIDDVLTSGSTLEASTSPLLYNYKVSIATLGFVE